MARFKKRGVEAALLEELEGRAAAVETKEAKVEREARKRKVLDEPRRISNSQQVRLATAPPVRSRWAMGGRPSKVGGAAAGSAAAASR